MSIRLWEEIANQKEEIEKQRQDILNAFKEHKVANEMGSLKAERLFRPITKKLGEPPKEPEVPGEDLYANFDRHLFEEGDIGDEMANLFDGGEELLGPNEGVGPKFVKNIPLLDKDDLDAQLEEEKLPLLESDDEVPPGEKPTRWSSAPNLPSYSEAFPRRKKKEAESVYLSTLEKFLNKKDPDAKLKIGDKTFTREEAENEAYAIFAKRAKQVLNKENIGKKKLGPFTGKSHKEIRKMLGEKMSGKGAQRPGGAKVQLGSLPSAGSLQPLIQRLTLGIFSIFAGNSSLKLREEVKAIAQLLFKNGIITQMQKNKVLSLK